MAAIVADTSAWVAYLNGENVALLETALGAGTLYLPSLVCTELLGTPLPKKDRRDLEALFRSLPLLGQDAEHFLRAGALKAELEEKGQPVSARDAHLLQCAIDKKALLLTRDSFLGQLSTAAQIQLW